MMEADSRQVPVQVLKFSRDGHLNAQTLRGIANDHIGRALQIEARAQDIGGICDHPRSLPTTSTRERRRMLPRRRGQNA